MSNLSNKLRFAINSLLPSGYQLLYVPDLSEEWQKSLKEFVKERTFSEQLGKAFEKFDGINKIEKGVKLSVTTLAERDFVVQEGWFSEAEVIIKKGKEDTDNRSTLDTIEQSLSDVKNVAEKLSNVAAVSFRSSYREMTPEQIRLAQDACYARMRTDPIFSGAIKQLVNYTVGTGVATTSQIPEINKEIENFIRINHFDEETSLEHRLSFRHYLEGEQFILCSVDAVTGDVYVGHIETHEVQSWEYHPRLRNVVLAYNVTINGKNRWIADFRYFDEIYESKNELLKATSDYHEELDATYFIVHIKEDIYPEFRGRPFTTAALRYFKYAEDFLFDRIILNHERSRVIWIRTILGRAASSLANYMSAPPGGVMLNQTEDIKYDVVNSEIRADDVKEDYLSIIYAIAACMLMPIHVLNMRADEQVYSSVLSAKAPFTKAISTWQDFFGKGLTKIYRVVLREKMKAKVLKNKYKITFITDGKESKKDEETLNIPLIHVFPNPVDEKLSERTTHEKFLDESGIVSKRTIRELNGFNNDQEKYRLAQEEKEREELIKKQPKPKADSDEEPEPKSDSDEEPGSNDRYSQ